MKPSHKTTKTSLKICGLTRREDLLTCTEEAVSYVGFNFYERSPRFIEPKAAHAIWIKSAAKTRPVPCAVVVDRPLAELSMISAVFPEIKVFQFHGKETQEYLEKARSLLAGRQIWKAEKISDQADLKQLGNFSGVADRLMVDGKNPGSGEGFDWELLKQSKLNISELILAGGIGLGNIAEALQLNPAMIDICTGAEEKPGIKDPQKIAMLARLFI